MKNKATLLHDYRTIYEDGAILKITVWLVPRPVPPCTHPFKYSLFYGFPGRRLVGYDNERNKGDHKHLADRECRYDFIDPNRLMADFLSDVAAVRGAGP